MDAKLTEISPEAIEERKSHSLLVDLVIRLVREKPLGTVGGVIVLVLFLVGAPPSGSHLMGADNLGRDLLSRIIFGARISMYVGLGASVISTVGATLIGIVSGWFGGKTDMVIQRIVDAFMCFPPLFLLLTVMAILGPGLIQVILVLGILTWFGSSRVVRSAVIAIKMNVYLEAAKAIGAPQGRIVLRHILPNIMAPIIIMFTVGMGGFILAEATLSFLGFGIPPPTPSWGGMLSESGRRYMLLAPWMALWPGLALAIVVYGINMLGDAARDILDPRLRGGLGRYGKAKVKETKA